MKRIVLSVTNDLYTDARVDKVSNTLTKMGAEVLLVGRSYSDSPTLKKRAYSTHRMRLVFRKGPAFYAEFNIRLFFYLLFVRCDILVANDLDTLLPNVLISRLKHKPLVYDSHEFFCQVLEVVTRPRVQAVWHRIEQYCFHYLEHIITVSDSIAEEYEKEYGKKVEVVKNVPLLTSDSFVVDRSELDLPKDKKIVILQGNAIHKDRGGEILVEAFAYLPDSVLLLVVGSGDAIPYMKHRVEELKIKEKVIFTGRLPHDRLKAYTKSADIGVSFDKNVCLNFSYSLPNKLFEYIHAGIPVLVSDLPERKKIVETYEVGEIVRDMNAKSLAEDIMHMITDENLYMSYKKNCEKAAMVLNWQNEEDLLKKIYFPLLQL